MSDAKHTLSEAVEGFDDDALLKIMLGQLVTGFPLFAGAPERVREARDRLVSLVEAAPDLLEVAEELLIEATQKEYDPTTERRIREARAAIAKARGES